MARSFNQVILMGNLTRDPELRQTPNGQNVCSFTLALNRRYKGADGEWQEVTDFIDIVTWGPLGERVAQYLSKGRSCLVSGRLQYRAWEQDGQKRNKVEVNAQDVTFLGGPSEGGSGGSSYGGNYNNNDSVDSSGLTSSASSGGSGNSVSSGSSEKGSKPAAGKKNKDDVAIEDIGDQPINLDDIPF